MTGLVRADKPAGVPLTDRRPKCEGFVEYVSRQRNQRLAPLHPLGTEASGAVLLAPVTPSSASTTPPASAVTAITCRWATLATGPGATVRIRIRIYLYM